MTDWAGTGVVVSSLLMAAWCMVSVLRNRGITLAQVIGMGVVELVVLAYVVLAIIRLADGQRAAEQVTFIGYLVAIVIILPIGAALAWLEPTRWGAVVATVACVVDPVLIVRLNQVWSHG